MYEQYMTSAATPAVPLPLPDREGETFNRHLFSMNNFTSTYFNITFLNQTINSLIQTSVQSMSESP